MTIEELEKQIASLQEEVRKLKEIKTAKPWRATKGEWYYYIDSDGIVVKDLDDYSEVHLRRFQFGNYYRCRELAHQGVNELRYVKDIGLSHTNVTTILFTYQLKQNTMPSGNVFPKERVLFISIRKNMLDRSVISLTPN